MGKRESVPPPFLSFLEFQLTELQLIITIELQLTITIVTITLSLGIKNDTEEHVIKTLPVCTLDFKSFTKNIHIYDNTHDFIGHF
jgi:hypothetical protein